MELTNEEVLKKILEQLEQMEQNQLEMAIMLNRHLDQLTTMTNRQLISIKDNMIRNNKTN